METYPTAHIDMNAIAHNFAGVKRLTPQSKQLVLLRCNAYGHGMIEVAQLLKDADAFGVDRIMEALTLRQAGVPQRILIREGVIGMEELGVCAEQKFDIVVHMREQIDYLEAFDGPPIGIWLKLDTGNCGIGFSPREFKEAFLRLSALSCVSQIILSGDLDESALVESESMEKIRSEIRIFEQVTKEFDNERSLVTSTGIVAVPEAHYEWVRPGLILFGITPPVMRHSPKLIIKKFREFQFWPAMTLRSRIISVRHLQREAGARLLSEEKRIALVQIGTFDGYPKVAPGTPVLIDGLQAPVYSGGTTSHTLAVDISYLPPEIGSGAEVILWGDELRAETVSTKSGVSLTELFGKLNSQSIRFCYQHQQFFFNKVWSIAIDGDQDLIEQTPPPAQNGEIIGQKNLINGKTNGLRSVRFSEARV